VDGSTPEDPDGSVLGLAKDVSTGSRPTADMVFSRLDRNTRGDTVASWAIRVLVEKTPAVLCKQ
jgi:hypothetical protein